MKLKNIVVILGLLCAGSAFAAGVPTADGIAAGQRGAGQLAQITQWGTELKQWTQEFENYKKQLQTQMKTLQAQIGTKDIVDAVSEIKDVYKTAKTIYDDVKDPQALFTQGADSLSGEASKLLKDSGLLDTCKKFTQDTDVKFCEGELINQIGKVNQQNQILDNLDAGFAKIEQSATKMKDSADIKTSQDLSNQMQAQMAVLQSQQMAYQIANEKSKVFEDYARKIKEKSVSDALKRPVSKDYFDKNFANINGSKQNIQKTTW